MTTSKWPTTFLMFWGAWTFAVFAGIATLGPNVAFVLAASGFAAVLVRPGAAPRTARFVTRAVLAGLAASVLAVLIGAALSRVTPLVWWPLGMVACAPCFALAWRARRLEDAQ